MDKEEYNTNNLISIFDNITMISISNNLFIKNKVNKKIDLIKRLSNTDIDILNYNNKKKEGLFNYLNSINTKFTTIKKNYNYLNNKLNTILGKIIHNAYLTSGYQILISNMPKLASQVYNNNIVIVDEEAIYDTIEMYTGAHTVLSIIKIDTNTYLAKLKDTNDARYLCSIIHKMQVETNIIRVEMLENIENCFNDEQITIEKNNSNSNNSNNTDIHIDNNIDSNIDNNINTTDYDISDYGYTNINIKKKTKTLIETYFELIYNKINYVLSYFWKK